MPKLFAGEYNDARACLEKGSDFDGDWRPLVKSLHQLMSEQGFDAGHAGKLDELRDKVKLGAKGMFGGYSNKEHEALLQAVGAGDGSNVNGARKDRLAALKMLRHVYLLRKSGNRQVWICSLPEEFEDWPQDHLKNHASTRDALRTILRSTNEHFSEEQKKHLSSATQRALSWCHKTLMVLTRTGRYDEEKAIVKRWFADPGTSEKDLNMFINLLLMGFTRIRDFLNSGQLILTDYVPARRLDEDWARDVLNNIAWCTPGRRAGDVVYIGESFFHDKVVSAERHAPLTIVHELSHLVCDTKDVEKGHKRYAWYGIGPHSGFTGWDAIQNAESWAYFSADCANALSDSERDRALKV